nr:unnamed protein product [Naegleria fowleri]
MSNQLPPDILKSLQMANDQQQQHHSPLPPQLSFPFGSFPNQPHQGFQQPIAMDESQFSESQILEDLKRIQSGQQQGSSPTTFKASHIPEQQQQQGSSSGTSSPHTLPQGTHYNIPRQDTPVPEAKPSNTKMRSEKILNNLSSSNISPSSSPGYDVSYQTQNQTNTPVLSPSTPQPTNSSQSPSSSILQKYVPTQVPVASDPFLFGPLDKQNHVYSTISLDSKQERKKVNAIKGITAYATDPIFSNGKNMAIISDYLAWTLKGGPIRVFNRKVGTRTLLKGHKQYVSDLQPGTDLKLASVSRDRSLIVWKIIETEEKTQEEDLRNPKEDQLGYSKLVHLTFSPKESLRFFKRILWAPGSDSELCAITSDNQLFLLDIEKLYDKHIIELRSENIESIDGIRILFDDIDENEVLTDISYSSDGKYLACVSSFGNIYLWDRRTNMSLVKQTNIYNSELLNIHFCSGTETNIERYFVTSSQNNFDISLWYLSPELDIELIQQISIRPEKFDENYSTNTISMDSTSTALFVANLDYPVLFTLRLNKTGLIEQTGHPHFDCIAEFDVKYPIVSFACMTIGSSFGLFAQQTTGTHLLNIKSSQIHPPLQEMNTPIPMPDLAHATSAAKDLVPVNNNTGIAVRQPIVFNETSNVTATTGTNSMPTNTSPSSTAGASSSNFEILAELRRMERTLLSQMETMIQTQTERQYDQLYKRIEQERIARLTEERKRQKELIETISSTLSNDLPNDIANLVTDNIMDNLRNSLPYLMNDSLKQSLTDTSDEGSIKKTIQDSFQTVLKTTVLPSFETSCRRMFEQISKTFERGMDELVKTPLKEYCRDVNNTTVETIKQELKNFSQHVSKSSESSSLTDNALKERLLTLIEMHRYQEVFTIVLEKTDLNLLVWLCTIIDPSIFEVECPLSQPVLLSLVQQLGFDITEQTFVKLAWLEKIVVHINPLDSSIIEHAHTIIEKIHATVSDKYEYIEERGKAMDLKTLKLVLHVLNSLIKDSRDAKRLYCK